MKKDRNQEWITVVYCSCTRIIVMVEECQRIRTHSTQHSYSTFLFVLVKRNGVCTFQLFISESFEQLVDACMWQENE